MFLLCPQVCISMNVSSFFSLPPFPLTSLYSIFMIEQTRKWDGGEARAKPRRPLGSAEDRLSHGIERGGTSFTTTRHRTVTAARTRWPGTTAATQHNYSTYCTSTTVLRGVSASYLVCQYSSTMYISTVLKIEIFIYFLNSPFYTHWKSFYVVHFSKYI